MAAASASTTSRAARVWSASASSSASTSGVAVRPSASVRPSSVSRAAGSSGSTASRARAIEESSPAGSLLSLLSVTHANGRPSCAAQSSSSVVLP